LTVDDLTALALRRNALLARMSVLADAPGRAGFTATYLPQAKATSKAPPPVHSVYAHWRDEFDVNWPAVPDDPDQDAIEWCYERAEKLVEQAEADLDRELGRLRYEPEETGLVLSRRIVKECEGDSLIRVAARFQCTIRHVRWLRRLRDRDPQTGRPVLR